MCQNKLNAMAEPAEIEINTNTEEEMENEEMGDEEMGEEEMVSRIIK